MEPYEKKESIKYLLAFGFLGLFIFIQLFDVNISIKPRFGTGNNKQASIAGQGDALNPEERVLPSSGVTLPVVWGDLGIKMASVGVIDTEKLEAIYKTRGGLSAEMQKLLYGESNGNLRITPENASELLNLFWALGLGTKNEILEKGPMMTYSGAASPAEALAKAGNFASTGGWILAKGDAMDHYSRHLFIVLTPEQQRLVERVSQNIYRPCCGNSVYFPDCNHGMAMLGLLELMASEGVSEEEMYRVALQVNSYWFPDTYLTIAKYFENRGVEWSKVNPKEALGSAYSSAQGYRQILEEIEPPQSSGGGGGCGV